MLKVKDPVSLVLTYVWLGFVCAISFLEAWLKFQAPGVTLPIGLSIGKLVFGALNKLEWVFSISILMTYLPLRIRGGSFGKTFLLVLVPFAIVVLQSFWLLPCLSARADLIIAGKMAEPSNLHFYYVGLEVVKVVCLSMFGLKLFSKE